MKENKLTPKCLELKDLSFRYDSRSLKGISLLNLSLTENECLCLIGPSGSGKSTTLKLIANLLEPQDGQILKQKDLIISYVPQSSVLPEKTVLQILMDEISYIDDLEKRENQARTILTLLNITNEVKSKPSEISGGQKQRVIIARALVKNPALIILDEPFGHLDELLRFDLMTELFTLFKENSISILWVTHETKEALAFSDRIAILNHGYLVSIGTPKDLYNRPPNLFTARFMGKTNIFSLKVNEVKDNIIKTQLFSRDVEIPKPNDFKLKAHKDLLTFIKPEFIKIKENGKFLGKLKRIIFQGSHNLILLQVTSEFEIWIYSTPDINLSKNQKITFDIHFDKVHVLDTI